MAALELVERLERAGVAAPLAAEALAGVRLAQERGERRKVRIGAEQRGEEVRRAPERGFAQRTVGRVVQRDAAREERGEERGPEVGIREAERDRRRGALLRVFGGGFPCVRDGLRLRAGVRAADDLRVRERQAQARRVAPGRVRVRARAAPFVEVRRARRIGVDEDLDGEPARREARERRVEGGGGVRQRGQDDRLDALRARWRGDRAAARLRGMFAAERAEAREEALLDERQVAPARVLRGG